MTTEPNPNSTSDPDGQPSSSAAPAPSMTIPHPPKKKRVDDPALPPDAGLKPVQLQRRRVWRACESCRCVPVIVALPLCPSPAPEPLPAPVPLRPPSESQARSDHHKIKCDGMEPTCSQCLASKSQCTWLQTKDRAALSRHYVQELEARLLQLETLFQQTAPILEQIGQATGLDLNALASAISANEGGTVPPTETLQGFLPRISESEILSNGIGSRSSSGQGSEGDDVAVKIEDDVFDAFGQLALDEHGHLHWIGKSSTMTLIQRLRDATTSPLHRVSPMEEDPLAPGPSVNKLYFPASVYFGKVRALPNPEEVEFPERDLADKLVEAYFARFHFLMPVLDKPDFMRRYRFLMDHQGDFQFIRTHAPFVALVCAVFAVASRFVDDPRLTMSDIADEAGMGMVYHERALILHYISGSSMQVEHVQCFLLMTSFLCSINCLPQAWLLVGQAVRAAQDIGLHRSPRRLLVSPIEKETRRKIWWGVYTLDRMLALALGRPLAIEDRDCDVEIPVELDDEQLPQYFSGATLPPGHVPLMRGFIELISLYKIAGRVLREVYAIDMCKDNLEMNKRNELHRFVETLDRTLSKWCEDLPAIFKSSPTTEKQVSMAAVLCSHYYSILTTLHRNFIPVRGEQPVAPMSTAKAVSTARACVRLAPSIKNVVPPSHHLAFFIQNLFSSAVIILLYAMHVTDPQASRAALEEARRCLVVLESWEGHWPGARKCKELLEDLTAKAGEAINTPGQTRDGFASAGPSAHSPSSAPMAVDGRAHGMASGPQIPGHVPERLIRNRPSRRNRSRDVPISPRNAHASSQFRADCESSRLLRADLPHSPSRLTDTLSPALRARSTSRKRPHDEDLYQDQYTGRSDTGLPSSYPGRSTLAAMGPPSTQGSSPISVNTSSPPGPARRSIDGTDTSPRMIQSNPYAPSATPRDVSVQIPGAGQRFDYDYTLPSPSSTTDRWASPAMDANELKFFPSDPAAQAQPMPISRPAFGQGHVRSFSGPQLSGIETSSPFLLDANDFNAQNGSGAGGGNYDPFSPITAGPSAGATGTTPPSAGFAAPGLPFHGLDFIRNYNPAGGAAPVFMGDQQEQYWQSSFDNYGVDPEMAFTLGGDFTTDAQWAGPQ
ncbi:fungal-specific transcription factor domain-containing protein [Epithele typhae]|uniref:fungal-specific transcription factor domain-containing protein n=1 Tax=Epithele typhae TaxID=378194 RepID=UPI002008B57D|nr:fungal-specific transcription factor domain-containing protein [Epithele typhae]KAH9943098.1 fungal-specific transcription factor domain-containing protein [Epithele typhae]